MTEAVGGFTVHHDHPALPGHFPGNPIVPGVVLLDEVLALVLPLDGRSLLGLPAVRFTRPVRPGERVEVRYAPAPTGGRVSCHVGGAEVLSGTLSFR